MIDMMTVAYQNYRLIEKNIKYHLALSDDFIFYVADATFHPDPGFPRRIENERVKFFKFPPRIGHDGVVHGAILDELFVHTTNKIVGTVDHDFFWLRQGSDWIYRYFSEGFDAIGAAGWYPLWMPDWQNAIDSVYPERAGHLAPVCWGQFIDRDYVRDTFISSIGDGPGMETGWRIRKRLIDSGAKVEVFPGFQYGRQPDAMACFFGTEEEPVGVHMLKGWSRVDQWFFDAVDSILEGAGRVGRAD